MKFPRLNLPQYGAILKKHDIIYAESVADFDKEFYVELGMAEEAVEPFLKGVCKAVQCKKKEKNRVK